MLAAPTIAVPRPPEVRPVHSRTLGVRGRTCAVGALPRLRVVYSHSARDVPIEELAELLEAQYLGPGRHWPDRHKLELAIAKSSAVAAAFAREAELHAAPGGQTAPQHQSSTLCLIGFARASSDMAFAATIHNVIVHPNARHRGIGRALLRRLTSQMKKRGVTDIGVMAPKPAWGFFYKADFDEDRETSIPLMLPRPGDRQVY